MPDMTAPKEPGEPLNYEALVEMFNGALIHTLRKHGVEEAFLDFWVPDVDPVLGIASMVDSARIGGLTEIFVRFSTATVPAQRLGELEAKLSSFCEPTFETTADHVLLHARDFRQGAGEASRKVNARRAYWQPGAEGTDTVPEPSTQRGPDTPDDLQDDLLDVHPHFRPGLRKVLGQLTREGAAHSPGPDLVEMVATEGAGTLRFWIDSGTHKVRLARHTGFSKPSERAVLDLYCKASEGLPIQEATDHSNLRVLSSLVDRDLPRPVPGVLLPVNGGPAFILPARLARQIYDAYRRQVRQDDTQNFFSAPPSTAWQEMSPEIRLEKARYVMRAFLQSNALHPDDLNIMRIEKNKLGYDVRVIIEPGERLLSADVPALMRRLEDQLRRDLEPELDLVAQRVKDTSPLRRLS